MGRYKVNGMSCAACVAAVERAVKKVPGVESVAVSLLLGSMTVEGTADAAKIVKAVSAAGYEAIPEGKGSPAGQGDIAGNGETVEGGNHGKCDEACRISGNTKAAADEDPLADRETPALKRRLLIS
ncbi:MAG: heavy-metal-associated domain-containing protein, partial [Lachnospiraceae bacterium]|nr:heavy-metal-associated domain-containing protein [Lachnospiraceae bacterium]